MLKAKTSALIAAISVLGTVAPAAFAQDINIAEIKDITQSNTNTFEISQSLSQVGIAEAETGDWSSGDADASVEQEASQGFCIQINQANQVSGDDSNNEQENEIEADAEATAVFGGEADAEAEVDCS